MNVGGAIARWRRPLATAAVLAIAVGASAWYAGRQRGQASGTSRFAELLAADFEHFRDEGSQVHFASSDRRAVADWLLEHTALAVVLPASGGSGRQLLGGRKCKINGQPAAFAIYDIDGVPVSVVVFAADVSELRGMEEVLRSDTTFWVDRCRGLVVAACRRDELVYAAVSTLAQEDLLNWLTEWKHQSP